MATTDHCYYCFETLVNFFEKKEPPKATFTNAETSYPLFVTWKKWHSPKKEWRLRGCKGTFSSLPLFKGLYDFALNSALKDTRFDPLDSKEVPLLYCGVSLLLEFEKCKDAYDWEVGKHGITIDFIVNSKSYGATYLPEVAPEQGWNHDDTLVSLVEKAGFKGTVNEKIIDSLQVERYQSSKASLEYSEYADMKKKL